MANSRKNTVANKTGSKPKAFGQTLIADKRKRMRERVTRLKRMQLQRLLGFVVPTIYLTLCLWTAAAASIATGLLHEPLAQTVGELSPLLLKLLLLELALSLTLRGLQTYLLFSDQWGLTTVSPVEMSGKSK